MYLIRHYVDLNSTGNFDSIIQSDKVVYLNFFIFPFVFSHSVSLSLSLILIVVKFAGQEDKQNTINGGTCNVRTIQ